MPYLGTRVATTAAEAMQAIQDLVGDRDPSQVYMVSDGWHGNINLTLRENVLTDKSRTYDILVG